MKKKNLTDCPVQFTMSLIGGKWKIVTLWYLKDETLRFSELRKRIPGNITQKMLSTLLTELEENGLVRRKVFAEVPPRVEYSLTEFGKSCIPMLIEIREWGDLAMEKHKGGRLKQLKYTRENKERLQKRGQTIDQPEEQTFKEESSLFTTEKRTYFSRKGQGLF